jgi:methionyl-tRNA formyltransferase
VVSFGHLIPNNIIVSFKHGVLNVHASLLPKYRGASPIIYAIRNHETKTGVTIMKIMPQKFDVGDVLAAKEVEISENILMNELHNTLAKCGAELLLECVKNYENIEPMKQDNSRASYGMKFID